MGFIYYVDHGTEACGAAKITYADAVITMSENHPSLGSCTDNEEADVSEADVSETERLSFSETSSIPAHIGLSLVIQNQTVPQRILVMTLTTVDFQTCHGKMSKKGGSSQARQVFLCTCVPFFVCTWKRTRHQPYIQYLYITCSYGT